MTKSQSITHQERSYFYILYIAQRIKPYTINIYALLLFIIILFIKGFLTCSSTDTKCTVLKRRCAVTKLTKIFHKLHFHAGCFLCRCSMKLSIKNIKIISKTTPMPTLIFSSIIRLTCWGERTNPYKTYTHTYFFPEA
jgi:hypothetical protein